MNTNWYKTHLSHFAKLTFTFLLFTTWISTPALAQQNMFGGYWLHTATSSNTTGNNTELDHPLINDDPDAIVFVTPVFNPNGSASGTYNDHSIGVYYFGGTWRIFNQGLEAMPEGASFLVSVPSSSSVAFVHTTTEDNITQHSTEIEHPALTENPNAKLLITQNWNPGGTVGGDYNNHQTGVWYDGLTWEIFNQGLEIMETGVSFNVMLLGDETPSFVHTTTDDNKSANSTFIDHPMLNENPNALLSISQNWSPPGTSGKHNNHEVGVWYSASRQKWAVFNQSQETMPSGASFNVAILNTEATSFVHTADADNIVTNTSTIDHPAINNNPDAIVIATPSYNPGGFGGTYNAFNTGVWYDGSKWGVFNQGGDAMTPDASFNVLVPGSMSASFKHTATSDNTSDHVTILDHPSLNGNAAALIHVTQNWEGFGNNEVYNDHPIGVYYHNDTWRIFNQDLVDMPENAVFNVLIVEQNERSFMFTAGASTITNNYARFNSVHTANNPKALVLATQNWEPNSIYNQREIGVWYIVGEGTWSIFNEDLTDMPANAAFNILVYGETEQGVANEEEHTVPESFTLNQNFPNPFNPATTISYDVATASEVELTVYNMMGQEIRTLVSGTQVAGSYEATFDAAGLASGTYLYRLTVGNQTQSKVMMLLK